MSLFLLQLRNELWKMFARKRTYIGFGGFLALELLILFMSGQPRGAMGLRRMIERNGYLVEQYLGGMTIAFQIVWVTAVLLGSIYLALVAGDIVSKEVEDGTLRMMLCRPVSRTRILVFKYLSCVIYTFVFAFFIGLSALATGVIYRGFGHFAAINFPDQIFAFYDTGPGLIRFLRALPLLGLSLTTITSIGFMFSCFNMKPAAATVCTLSVIFLDIAIKNVPFLQDYQQWFITTHMSAWVRTFIVVTPWWDIVEDYARLIAFDATFVLVGLGAFQQRDFKT